MRKEALAFTALALAMIFSVSMSLNVRNVGAYQSYAIDHVDHAISVLYNGCVLMNDTVEVSGQVQDSFLLGLPYAFGSSVLRCLAFNTDNRSDTFPVSLSEPMEDRIGFYGLKVDFSKGAPQNFTVEVLLSNALVYQNAQNVTVYTVAFPAFPSLVSSVGTCNVSVVLPRNAVYLSGTVSSLNYSEANLPAFTYNSSTLTFNVPNNEMQLFDVDQLMREITVGELEDITGTDSYYITNEAANSISSVEVVLPPNASDVSANDQFGRTMSQPQLTIANTSRYTVTLSQVVDPTKSSSFTVSYSLPSEGYLVQQSGANSYALDIDMFQGVDYYINFTTVSFVLPEGGRLQSFEDTLAGDSYGISRGVFQEGAVVSAQGMSSLDSFSVEVVYEFNPLWLGFRPTIWVLALASVGCLAIVVSRRQKVVAPVSIPAGAIRVRPEFIRSFVESYEEKMKIVSEIGSLESKARKGRLPRRRYKVQRRTLETRLDALSRSLAEAKEKMRSAGGHYASLMRELEVAETGMNEYEANVRTIDARLGRGELSMEAYRRLLDDYQRRKERSEATVNGILLRLREEMR